MNKVAYITISLVLVIGIGAVFFGRQKNNADSTLNQLSQNQLSQNVEVRDGIQYVTIKAKAGYFPSVSTAKAGIQTKLVVQTNGTYDCSASLVIRSIGYQKILPQTGEETIPIGIPRAGQSLQGLCSMGMYNFKINFSESY